MENKKNKPQKTKFLLSIIVPVYNCRQYVEATFSSIEAVCKEFEIEVIIQNANSSDGTTEIIDSFRDKFKNFNHFVESDLGQSDAINKGVLKATGEWVTWLCADDLLLNGFGDILNQARKGNFDVIYGDVVMLTGSNLNPAIGTEPFEEGKLIKKRMYIQQPGTIIRRSKWNKVGGLNLSLNWTMDYDLFIRLEQAGSRFFKVNRFVAVARIHDEAKTSSGSLKRLKEHYGVFLGAQRSNPGNISVVPYASYLVEYLIKKLEERGYNPVFLHRLFWKINRPKEKEDIESRFGNEKKVIEKNVNYLESISR